MTGLMPLPGLRNSFLGIGAFDAGADEYVTKPLSLEYLEKVVLLKFINSQIKDLGEGLI